MSMNQVFLLALLIALWGASPVVTGRSTVTVRLTNYLPHNLNATIHCKSKDNDLGEHVLPVYSKYEFSFKPNIFGTTLFFCGITWRDASIEYEIYSYKRDHAYRCATECNWLIKEEALICLSQDDAGQPNLIVPWKTKAHANTSI
ncbi:hypothetical protein RIF29_34310 [Crotalaria pallida]|uniref:S-protein homolog n=1 Tax=Crotalaria pallida TaxID=3830 RepID=A0AAN9EA04_CROPI